jgi:hypothetical protein
MVLTVRVDWSGYEAVVMDENLENMGGVKEMTSKFKRL